MTLGDAIRQVREERGLTQKRLAEAVGMTGQYLNDIEFGRRNPDGHELLARFAAALDVPADYLSFHAGRLPRDVVGSAATPEQAVAAFDALRAALEEQ